MRRMISDKCILSALCMAAGLLLAWLLACLLVIPLMHIARCLVLLGHTSYGASPCGRARARAAPAGRWPKLDVAPPSPGYSTESVVKRFFI